MTLPRFLLLQFIYGSLLTIFVQLGSGGALSDRDLPPLVPPKLVDDDDYMDERDVDAADRRHPVHPHQLLPSYWAPTLDNLSPGEPEFYRKALLSRGGSVGRQHLRLRDQRSMSMLRMGRSADDVMDEAAAGVKRSMTMLRMGRAFDEDNDDDESEERAAAAAEKRSMGMLRMGRNRDDYRKSMSMLRMGRASFSSQAEDEQDEDADEGRQVKRSMGMLRMGRASANKNVDRGALNMLRMGKRETAQSNTEDAHSTRAAAAAEGQLKRSS